MGNMKERLRDLGYKVKSLRISLKWIPKGKKEKEMKYIKDNIF